MTISSRRLRNSGRKCARTASITSRAHRRAVALGCHQRLAAEVRGQHDQRVAEIDRAALAVGQPPLVEHLQQHVEHVGMRLLDLVEQHDLIGPAAHRLGQHAALVIADIARRARRSAGRRSASPCIPTCRCAPSPARRRTGRRPAPWSARSCPRRSGRGTGTLPSGRFGSFSPARARRTAFETARTASSCPTTRLPSSSSMRSSFSRSPSSILSIGMPVQRSTTAATCSGVTASSTITSAFVGLGLGQLALQRRDDAIGQLARPGEVALALGILQLDARLVQLFLQLPGAAKLLALAPASGRSARPTSASSASSFSSRASRSFDAGPSPSSAPRASICFCRISRSSARAPRASNRPPSAGGSPPRPSGRSPCRAGSGR
ncbi:MAG: hypothetical protein KatS3mg118_0040 [Paracoccaceae bacterium]|nr:MAG: hypothetical protein KatS3mg118_0040 [Paracoccaceae bacterium]